MAALKARQPDIEFEGIGGDKMLAQGMHSRVPLDKLSVMGLVEVLRELPSLLKIRRDLVAHWSRHPPDLFIGIDAPDFNLGLEIKMRKLGVPTVHYVSPTIWAWREKRAYKIKRAADLVLSIFPFEAPLLKKYGIPVSYVGHPLAAEYPGQVDQSVARESLGLKLDRPVLALLPGSRANEVKLLSEPFLKTALACAKKLPGLQLVVPLINAKTRRLFEQAIEEFTPSLDVQLIDADTQIALSAADVALVASGTATFEALLCECPMVVGYKANPISYNIIMALKLVNTRYVAMANILADEGLAPEFIQSDCEPGQLIPAVLHWFEDPAAAEQVRLRYRDIHAGMTLDTNQLAASAVMDLLEKKHGS